MTLEVPYERQIIDSKTPVLDVSADGITLTIPAKFYRWELGSMAFYCCAMWFQVAMSVRILVMLARLIPTGMPPPIKFAMPLALGLGAEVLWASACIAFLYRRCRLGPVPRRLHVCAGELHHSRRGIWRVVTRTYPLSRITEIRCNTIKGLLGKPAGAMVIIRLGPWRAMRLRFGRKQMDLAKQVTAEFKQAVRSVGTSCDTAGNDRL